MQKFRVTRTETILHETFVFAENKDDALDRVIIAAAKDPSIWNEVTWNNDDDNETDDDNNDIEVDEFYEEE